MVWYSCFIVLYLHSICTLLTNLRAVFRLCKKEVSQFWLNKEISQSQRSQRKLYRQDFYKERSDGTSSYTEQSEELDRD